MSLSLNVPRSVERKTRLPIREKAGRSSALATPIWADCATACSSALRMSGRRRSRSAGMPTMTWGGETGIADGPSSRSPRSFGAMPSSTLEGVPRLASLRLERGERRVGVEEHGPGLLDVELGHGAVREPGLDDLQGLLLDVDVLQGDADALLRGPERDVGVGHVRGQGDQRVVVVREGREQAGIGRLDVAPDPSPEVELPARLRPDRSTAQYSMPPPPLKKAAVEARSLVRLYWTDPMACCVCGKISPTVMPSWARACRTFTPACWSVRLSW